VTVEERARIARELHDIVAHSLSVIVVQAEGGRALAAKRPERAAEVLGTIAETSREALEEMRRMVQLLRSGNGEPEKAAYLPTPGLEDLADLVRKTSEIAQFTVFGAVPKVSRALGLSAYRIVQESLTNVLKHAGPDAVARVTVAYTAEAVEIEVSDDGRGASAGSDGLGHGLQGMRERVALHGGTFTSAPRPEGGFTVRARLPYAHEPSIPIPLRAVRPADDRGWVA
jgi:signal transduction histidine kinase